MINTFKKIPVFLYQILLFSKTTVPLNIFEPRYIDMINDLETRKIYWHDPTKKSEKSIKWKCWTSQNYCLGKIISFAETEDKRYLIELKGVIRFNIINETNSDKQYRECNVSYENFMKIKWQERKSGIWFRAYF